MNAPATVPRLDRASRPVGYFVHHQGRGHAERAAALIRELPDVRPVTLFCARPDILPPLPERVEVVAIPSLFEARGDEIAMDRVPQPETVHCAPLGWPAIREGMGLMAEWMRRRDPALLITDVSAEVAQLARIMSVPHIAILQHGDRSDPGHRAALDGAAGILAPFDAALCQPDWEDAMRRRTHFAGGLGIDTGLPPKDEARARLGIAPGVEIVLAITGTGGSGLSLAPLSLGARATPEAIWFCLGPVGAEWHATPPANLRPLGWVDDPRDHFAAADLLVASTGNTTCQMALAAGLPWVAVPEWRYFDEQARKAEALARAGLAIALPSPPASIPAWRAALVAARAGHDPARQRAMVDAGAAGGAARWLEAIIAELWDAPARQGVPT